MIIITSVFFVAGTGVFVVDDSFGFDDVAFARQSRSRLFFFDEEEEGEETTTGVLDSIVILSRVLYI
jgi:hypothetical protein